MHHVHMDSGNGCDMVARKSLRNTYADRAQCRWHLIASIPTTLMTIAPVCRRHLSLSLCMNGCGRHWHASYLPVKLQVSTSATMRSDGKYEPRRWQAGNSCISLASLATAWPSAKSGFFRVRTIMHTIAKIQDAPWQDDTFLTANGLTAE